jgi:hypothetical protein
MVRIGDWTRSVSIGNGFGLLRRKYTVNYCALKAKSGKFLIYRLIYNLSHALFLNAGTLTASFTQVKKFCTAYFAHFIKLQ